MIVMLFTHSRPAIGGVRSSRFIIIIIDNILLLITYYCFINQSKPAAVPLGYGAGFDDIIYHGEPVDGTFVAYYTK